MVVVLLAEAGQAEALETALAGERAQAALARELTKLHETVRVAPLAELAAWVADDPDQPRNETFYGLAHDRPELDGLLTRTRGLVLGDAVRVDAGRLYEVINRAVEVRLDVDALVEALRQEVGEGEWSGAAEALRVALAKLQGEAA